MSQAHVIEVEGAFIGAAVPVQGGYLFRCVHPRLEDLDSWRCASLDEMRRVARECFMAGRGGAGEGGAGGSGAPTPSHSFQTQAGHGVGAAQPTYRAPPAASGLLR